MPEVDPLVHALLERQLDAEPDRHAARLVAALVRGLHDAGPAAGDHGVAGVGQLARRAPGRARTTGARGWVRAEPKTVTAAAARRAGRSPRRTPTGCAAPATGRCAPSRWARGCRAAAGRWCSCCTLVAAQPTGPRCFSPAVPVAAFARSVARHSRERCATGARLCRRRVIAEPHRRMASGRYRRSTLGARGSAASTCSSRVCARLGSPGP